MTEEVLLRIEKEKKEKTGKLNLFNCRLKEIPQEINQLTWLTQLDLSHNQRINIQKLDELNNLNTLDLSYSQITNIQNLEKLNNLTELNLSVNKINDIQNLEKLNKLTHLNLSGNNVTNIQNLEKLNKLTYLNLSENQITHIQNLEKLRNLTHLYLYSNQITNIESLASLKKIDILDLSNNKIKSIAGLLDLFKSKELPIRLGYNIFQSSRFINLYNNPIQEPPIDVIEKGRDEILNYFRALEKHGRAPMYESKLMILGQGGAGKTTFAKLQTNPKYIVKKDTDQSTLGIDIYKNKEYTHTEKPKVNIKAHLWDFGGQEIQKMLHQFFITKDCLYVVVSDKRQENTNFNYWFQIVELLGPNSPVLVLENPKNTAYANEAFPVSKYQSAFPGLKIQTLEVNLAKTRGSDSAAWNHFNALIAQKLSDLKIVNLPVIATWGPIRQKLDQLNAKYISTDYYYKTIANEVELNGKIVTLEKEEAKQCLGYLNALGDLTHFDEQGLSDIIFLDHNWVTEGLYYILSDKNIEKGYGTFTRQQAFAKWEQKGYSEAEKNKLLSLLLKDHFDICYKAGDNTYITPLLLPNDRPEGNKWHYETNLWFKYQYDFMPHGLFSRFIVQVHERIHKQIQWKNGVWLHDDEGKPQTFAEVLAIDHPNRAIEIKIHGQAQACKQMLEYIDNALNNLHKDFKNLQVQKMAACVCPTCKELIKNGEKPYFHSFTRIKKRLDNNEYTTECGISGKNVDISDILLDLGLKKEKEGQDLKQTFNFLKELEMSINKINIQNNPVFNNTPNNNNSSNSSSSSQSSSESNVDIKISIEIINKITAPIKSLREDIEDAAYDLEEEGIPKKDVNSVKNNLKRLETGLTVAKEEIAEDTKKRFTKFLKGLADKSSAAHKVVKGLTEAKHTVQDLVTQYNDMSTKLGLPPLTETLNQIKDYFA